MSTVIKGAGWIIKRLIYVILVVFVLVGVLGYYLTATNSGYRQLIKLVNALTPFTLTYNALSGNLWQGQSWRNLQVTGPGISVSVDTLKLDWVGSELWKKRAHIRSLEVSGVQVHLTDTHDDDSAKSFKLPHALSEVRLPVAIEVDSLRLDNVAIYQDKLLLGGIDRFVGSMQGKGDRLAVNADAALFQGRKDKKTTITTALSGEMTLSGEYPLAVSFDATAVSPDITRQDLKLRIDKSILNPKISAQLQGLITGELVLDGQVNLANEQLMVNGHWKDIRYQNVINSTNATFLLTGAFDDLEMQFSTVVNGEKIPDTTLQLQANITPSKVADVRLSADTLEGIILLRGEVEYGEKHAIKGQITVQDIDTQHYDKSRPAQIQRADILFSGALADTVAAQLEIVDLNGQWQNQPLKGQGRIMVHDSAVQLDDFFLTLAGNKIRGNGVLGSNIQDSQTSALRLDIDAPALNKLVPGLYGAVKGIASVTGKIDNPLVDAQLDWQKLSYSEANKEIVLAKQGSVKVKGLLSGMDVRAQTEIVGADIPEAKIDAVARVSPTQAKDIVLDIATLGGHVHATGGLDYAENITWSAQAVLNNIQPGKWKKSLDGNVSAQAASTGKVADGHLNLRAVVDDIKGKWQGQALNGEAKIQLDDERILLDGLKVSVGSNIVEASGGLNGKAVSLDFSAKIASLAAFYPELAGRLTGEGKLYGDLPAIALTGKISGDELKYKDKRVGALRVTIDSGSTRDSAFNNSIELRDVGLGTQRWGTVVLRSQGKFSTHKINAYSEGGDINANLTVKGGFSGWDNWAGQIATLALTGENINWTLLKPASIAISPDKLIVKAFCPQDAYSQFCINITSAEQTTLDYAITQIDPRSFKPWLPEAVEMKTTATGKGTLAINKNNTLSGKADIVLAPGKIIVRAPDQPPVLMDIKRGELVATFTGSQGNGKFLLDLGQHGKLSAAAVVSNFSSPIIQGNLSVDVPDIGKFGQFLPQTSDMSGKVKGAINVAGALNKPQVSGEITLDGGKVNIPQYATELKDIRLKLSAARDGNVGITGNIGTPKGNLTANGKLVLQPLTLQLALNGKDMLLADAKNIRIIVTPRFDIQINPQTGIVVTGDVFIPEAKVSIPDTRSAKVISEDVVIVNNQTQKKKHREEVIADASTPLRADIRIRLGDKVFFKNQDFSIRLIGGITALVRPGEKVTGKGRIEVASGVYALYGQELNIKRGWVTFSGDITNPAIDILAFREVENVKVGAHITGVVKKLRLALISDPALPDSSVLSYLLFGRPPDSAMDGQALAQTAAVIATKGLFSDNFAEKTGLDVLDIGISGLKAGKYLTRDLYVGMQSNFFTSVTKFLTRYRLTNRLSVEGSTQENVGAVDLLYEFETN